MDIIEQAKETLQIEAQAILNLIDRIDESFVRAVEVLYNCKGRIVVTGMGKSGIIGKKIASTLASTGSPALFLHSAEAAHGDLGMVTREDVIIALSNSGETKELTELISPIKRKGATIISLTGNPSSTLAKHSDIAINVFVEKEACPLGLAPTASTTATLAMGDAMAVSLLKKRGFKEQDFASLHPGGSLGKRLILTVKDVMHTGDQIPMVLPEIPIKHALFEITSKKLGITLVVNDSQQLMGIITDGDLRRLIERQQNIWDIAAKDAMAKNPKTVKSSDLAVTAVAVMQQYSITTLAVTDEQNYVQGVIHLHDLLKAGIV
ncbi:KpsF/GutQ family sugar-phosphate isomerase [bacterium]|nr:KpsF/GutQ family sugar-phosphate isomerase [bacterium]MBU1753710.1 KpsF/GutQ family sugar-phosphate isomerase [bacterium]